MRPLPWSPTIDNFVCACAKPTPVIGTMSNGDPRVSCEVCLASRPVLLVHYIWKMRMTACAMAYSGDLRNTLQVGQVTCPDCVDMLVTELVDTPRVDWRPDACIAEDHYAI